MGGAMRWLRQICGAALFLTVAFLLACGSDSDEAPEPVPTLEVHPAPTREPGCTAFQQQQVPIPNANAPMEGATYRQTLVGNPTRLATLVSFGEPELPTSSWLLFDGAGMIASQVQPDRAEPLGVVENCVREASALANTEREYVVLSTPAPSDYSISVDRANIKIPSGARVGRLSNDLPEDSRTIARGASHLNLNSSGITDSYVVEEDEAEFRPLFEALAAVSKDEFPAIIEQLDNLPYPSLPLPSDLPVTSFYVGGALVTVPSDTTITSYMSSCAANLGCFADPLIVQLGNSVVAFELTGPKILGIVRVIGEARLEPLIAALERASAAANPG
jgi:hypothetical protein